MKKIVIVCIVIYFGINKYVAQQEWTLELSSSVELRTLKLTNKAEKEDKPLAGASIKLFQGSKVIAQATSVGSGDFELQVPANGEFILEVSYKDCNQKKFQISTKGVPDNIAKDNFRPTFNIGGAIMAKPLYSIDYSILKQPMAKIYYHADSKKIDHDDNYTDQILSSLEKMKKAEDDLIERFLEKVNAGDKALKKPDCPLAKQMYDEALALIPNEQYPIDQLVKVGFCLKEKEDAVVKQKAALEKIAADKLAKEKELADKATAEKLAKEKEAADKIAKEQAAKAKEASEKLVKEKEEEIKNIQITQAKEAADKIAKEQASKAKEASEKLAKEKEEEIKNIQITQAKEAADKTAKEQAAKSKETSEKLAKEKEKKIKNLQIAQAKETADKIAKEQAVKSKEASEKLAKEKVEQEKIVKEQNEKQNVVVEAKEPEKNSITQLKEPTPIKEKETILINKGTIILPVGTIVKSKEAKYSTPQVIGGEQKYRDAIKEGNNLFKRKRFEDAKKYYEEALKYKPEDDFAMKRLAEILSVITTK
jgi:hypothetical protein